ncbi:MAG: hypothetical protein LBP50_10580 [Tannerella sp.]|jgi:hypothetical protein|nr:hypothetical protein [Tannerella sp.]
MAAKTSNPVRVKRLRRKIVFMLLRHPACDPSQVIAQAENICRYLTGAFPKDKLDEYFTTALKPWEY